MDNMKEDYDSLKEIGARMRNIRTINGLRQQQVAEKLSISLSHYSKIEVGLAKASVGLLRRFCSVFKVDESWLETGSGTPSCSVPQVRETASPYDFLMGNQSQPQMDIKDMQRELDRLVGAVLDVLQHINLDNVVESAGKLHFSPDKLLRMVTVEKMMQRIQSEEDDKSGDEDETDNSDDGEGILNADFQEQWQHLTKTIHDLSALPGRC